ncbi:MAG: hypothetical protein NUW37_17595 [Planctomycetes bacterium]|nr:hypothetical protein [Planctomycetota bacterium]
MPSRKDTSTQFIGGVRLAEKLIEHWSDDLSGFIESFTSIFFEWCEKHKKVIKSCHVGELDDSSFIFVFTKGSSPRFEFSAECANLTLEFKKQIPGAFIQAMHVPEDVAENSIPPCERNAGNQIYPPRIS